jgi:nucleotide-binding universal stress UspA family protein
VTTARDARTNATNATNGTAKIVVGVDGSEGSKNALRWAAGIADAVGAHIVAVSVWDEPSTYGWSSLPPLSPPHPHIEKVLNQVIEDVFGSNRPANLETRVCQGSVAGTLVALGETAELLVVGSRGLGGMTGLLLGSVSARVAEYASCPVVVVHGNGASITRAA